MLLGVGGGLLVLSCAGVFFQSCFSIFIFYMETILAGANVAPKLSPSSYNELFYEETKKTFFDWHRSKKQAEIHSTVVVW